MFSRTLGLAGLVLSVSVMACGAASPDATDDASNEDALTSASEASKIKGAWTLTSDNTSITAIVFNGNHTFFRANARILNGVVINGGPSSNLDREEGHWSLSASKHTITFTITNGLTQTLNYSYKAAPVLNGMFLPGQEPKAKLSLTGIPAPHSHIAFPATVYEEASSFCFDATDCHHELSTHIWTPASTTGTVACSATNACEVGTRCGNAVCSDGLVCCNPIMGICTPPGGVCIQ